MKTQTTAQRLRELRGDKSQTAFCKLLEVPQPTYSTWERATSRPNNVAIAQIAAKCGVSSDWLLGLTSEKHGRAEVSPADVSSVREIPVVGMAAAAMYDPTLGAIDDLFDPNDTVPCILETSLHPVWAVRISGDSMKPTLLDGDVVAVSDVLPATGDLCIVNHRQDGVLCKRWYWRNGVIRLESDNPEGRSYEWTKEQFREEQPLVWRWRVYALIRRNFI